MFQYINVCQVPRKGLKISRFAMYEPYINLILSDIEGITIFKIFILGGILSDIRSEF